MSAVTYEVLRAHLIAEHGYTDAYFDTDYPVGGPINDLSTLRWLHACWSTEKGHRDVDILPALLADVAKGDER